MVGGEDRVESKSKSESGEGEGGLREVGKGPGSRGLEGAEESEESVSE